MHDNFATHTLVIAIPDCVLSDNNFNRRPPCLVSVTSIQPSLHPNTIASLSFHHSDTNKVDIGIEECKFPIDEERSPVFAMSPPAGGNIAVVAPKRALPRASFVGSRVLVLELPRKPPNPFFDFLLLL